MKDNGKITVYQVWANLEIKIKFIRVILRMIRSMGSGLV
jgi:hypothetical protein